MHAAWQCGAVTRPHPRETLARCALRSQLRGDPALGTAFPASRLLLVEQPGPWGPDGLLQSHFDASTARALLRRTNADGVRVQVSDLEAIDGTPIIDLKPVLGGVEDR